MGNKGLDLIKEACKNSNVKFVFIDTYAKNVPNKQLLSHEQLRDQLYYKAEFYINASEYEGTPNPALESLACGLPVITTMAGNMPEIIQNGLNGFIVKDR